MELTRTTPITPTALASYELCPAGFLLARERFPGKLVPASVSSIKGNLMHGLIESYSMSGQMPNKSALELMLEQQQPQYRWLSDIEQWPSKWDIRKLVGVVERGNLLQLARQKIRAYQSHIAVDRSANSIAGTKSGAATEANPFGIELEYRHEELELQGRADLTYGEGTVATVVDFKSGQTKCAEGKLKRSYYLQLGAYGLMLQRVSTAKTIMLKAEGPDTTSNDAALTFDQDHRSTIIGLCRDIISTFPHGKAIQLESLERYGQHCRYCTGKGVCKAFNSAMRQATLYPELSQMGSVLARDITLESTTGGWLNLIFRAVSGKEGRVINVPPSRAEGLQNGQTVVLHNLKWGSKFSDGAVYNFYVADLSRPEGSSFDFVCHVES